MSKLLGMMLVDAGKITTNQLAEALNIQQVKGGLLGEILVEINYIDRATLDEVLKEQKAFKKG